MSDPVEHSAASGTSATLPFEERYEILGELGRGGFGTVWKARQRSTGQLCALKTLDLESRSDDAAARRALRRFEREMALIAQLDSPHVVKLYDSGVTSNGHPFLALELVRGVDLRTLLRRGPLDPAIALRIMVLVLDAVANAHEQGIVHRDLKPENIMISVRGGRVSAKVLDFGIAGVVEEAQADGATLTLDQDMLGTPCYMPPEQIRRSKDVTPASDVYAVGLILAELLTGKKAVTGSTVHIILAQQIISPVVLPDDLEASPIRDLIDASTNKDPNLRFVNAAAMLVATESVLPSDVPAQPGALTLEDVAVIESAALEKADISGVEVVPSPFNLTPGGSPLAPDGDPTIAATPRAQLEQAEESEPVRSGTWFVVLALLLVAGAVGVVAFSLLTRSAETERAETDGATSSQRLSDDELGVDALLAQAREAKRDGQDADAVELYEQVIDREPGHLVAREELGWVLLSMQRFKDALVHFAFLVDRDVQRESVLLGVAISYEGVGDEAQARGAFGQFLATYPDSDRRDEVEARLAALELSPPDAVVEPDPVDVEATADAPADLEEGLPERRRRRRRGGSADEAGEGTGRAGDGEDFGRVELFE